MHKWAKNSICGGLIYYCWLAGSHKSLLSMRHFSILQFNLICAQENKTFSDIQGGKKTIGFKNQQQAAAFGHSLEKRQDVASAPSTWEHTDLAGLRIDVSFCEELLHDLHVLWTLHGCERSQHDGRVTRLVLLIHVTHLWSGGQMARVERREREERVFLSSLIYWWYLHSLPLSPECTMFSGQPIQK